jgi:DNA polymerase-3 subunit alpha
VGKFDSIYQVCAEVDQRHMNKRVLESLIKGGALDSLGAGRSRLYAVVESAMEAAQQVQRDRESGQHGLFGATDNTAAERNLPDLPEWPEAQVLAGEKEVLGFYLTGHPMQKYAEKLRELGTVKTARLAEMTPKSEIAIGGIITSVRTARSKKGEIWASAVLEDLEGTVELLVLSEAYKRLSQKLQAEAIVYVKGRLLMEDGSQPKIRVDDIASLDSVEPALPTGVVIRVKLGNGGGNGNVAQQLFDILQEKTGQTPIRLEIERERDFQAILEPDMRIKPDTDFVARVRKLCGKDSVRLV